MAKKNARVGKTYKGLVNELTINNIRMQAQDIGNWVRAIDAARSETNPKRRLLLELYDNIKIDGHLESVMNKRKIAVTNKRLHFAEQGKEGEVNEFMRDNVLETPWLHQAIGYIMEAKAYGHSLIEFIPDSTTGGIKVSKLIPRVNVKPETGFLMWHYANETDGVYFREDKKYSKFLLEAGGEKDYGLLMVAAQYVIYKRGGFGDWAQFAEIFGMPFRVGKYNPYDDTTRQKLEEALKNMGGAGHAVIPDGTSLEFFNPTNTGQSDVFKDLVEACNKEISKTFLGQTMTTEDGSSRSQSETHKEVEEDINLADLIEVEYLLNWELVEKLKGLGMPIPDGRFYFDQSEQLSLAERIKIDIEVAKHVKFKPEYWYETYGIDVPEGGPEALEQVVKDLEQAAPTSKEEESKKKAPTAELVPHTCLSPLEFKPVIYAASLSGSDEEYIKNKFEGDSRPYDPARLQQVTGRIKSGLRQHLPVSIGYGEPDYLAATMMELNINRFGFDKSLFEVVELNKALNLNETFPQFLTKARGILLELKNHLETEYNLAIATAQNAAAYNRQRKEQEQYPYLKYQTVGDENVRNSHKALDGKLFAVKDPILSQIYPPNGYNCRCEMVQVPRSQANITMLSNGDDARKDLGDDWFKMKDTGFLVNRGELGQVFDLNKHYVSTGLKEDHKLENITFNTLLLQPWVEFKDSLKKAFRRTTITPERTIANFDRNATNGTRIYKDYEGRAVSLSRQAVLKHTKEKYVAQGRHQITGRIREILEAPDEVWLSSSNQYHYIKFYSDTMIMVVVEVTIKKGLVARTWFEIIPKLEEQKRSGILIKGGK